MSSHAVRSRRSARGVIAPISAPIATRGIIHLGLDVHKDSITIAVLPVGARSADAVDRIPNELPKLKRYLDRVAQRGELRCCYEASSAGYVVYRALREWGYACDVIAPSLIPKKVGVQRKNDKRDATELARLHRSGDLTAVRVPSAAAEAVRDVVRCRATLSRECLKSRHYVLKFLARRGQIYRGGTHWKTPHLRWLQQMGSESSPLSARDRLVFREYWELLQYKLARRDALDAEVATLATLPEFPPAVRRLICFRGIAVHAAMVLVTEIGDWRRFERSGQLAAYLGLVSREDSSGPRQRLGSITKAGNSHCRHVLVEAAWHYHHRPNLSDAIKKRQQGQPASVVAHAWKAQQRLHARFNHLSYRKEKRIAVVGVARELVGFLWAVMQDAPAEVSTM